MEPTVTPVADGVGGQEVSCSGLAAMLDHIIGRGIPLAQITKGTSTSIGLVKSEGAFIPWADFCRGLENIARQLSDEEIAEVGHFYLNTRQLLRFRASAGLSCSADVLYRFIFAEDSGAAMGLFRPLRTRVEELGREQLQIAIELLPGYAPSRAFDLFAKGVVEAVPTIQGLPPAHVLYRRTEQGARYDVTLQRTRAGRVRALVSWPARTLRALRRRRSLARLLRGRSRALNETRQHLGMLTHDYETLMEQASDGIAVADAELRALHVNSALCEMAGRSKEEILGRAVFEFIVPEELTGDFPYARRVLEGESVVLEHTFLRKDGSRVPVEISAKRLDDGRIQAFFRDISERRKLDEQRREYERTLEQEIALRVHEVEEAHRRLRELQQREIEAERLGAAQDLAASVAHVVNNPLAALLGTLEMHRESSGVPQPMIERSIALARRIQEVVSETLRLHRRGPLRLQPVAPEDLLEQVRSELEGRIREHGITLEAKADADLPAIQADRTLLVAALVSVAENAIECQRNGGWIGLQVSRLGDGIVRFSIADQGPGIPAEIRSRVFEPYFTTKGGGTGLGLAIARNIIRGHAGSIRIDPSAGRGTRVRIDIPIRAG